MTKFSWCRRSSHPKGACHHPETKRQHPEQTFLDPVNQARHKTVVLAEETAVPTVRSPARTPDFMGESEGSCTAVTSVRTSSFRLERFTCEHISMSLP